MSCATPLRILNRSKRFDARHDKMYFDVPCGKCFSCRKSLQDEWLVRSYFQTLETSKSGFSLMYTLTYNDNNIPYMPFSDIPCFSKLHITRFLNTLRKSLQRQFDYDGLKYMICSEYGDKFKRPHYHIVLHFPNLDKRLFSNVHSLIGSSWHYGFVKLSRNKVTHSPFISGYYASRYTSKYCTKDINFYDYKLVSDYLEAVDITDEIKQCLPFHRQSHGYGSFLLDIVKSDLNLYDERGLQIELSNRTYSIPRYIINKLIYDYDDNGLRYLNYYGKRFKAKQFDYLCDKSALTIDNQISNLSLYNSFNFSQPDRIFTIEQYNTLMRGRSSKLLAQYKLFYKDRPCPNKIPYISQTDFINTYFLKYIFKPRSKEFEITHKFVQLSIYNNLNIFNDFDVILQSLSDCIFNYNVFKMQQQEKFHVTKYRTREMLFINS